MPRQIDWDELRIIEGFRTEGYVPRNRKGEIIGRSGVTIGYGVDIGQRNAAEIRAWNLPKPVIEKLTPYCLLKGWKAADALRFRPLKVSALEARMISEVAWKEIFARLAGNYDSRSLVDFDDLPKEAQNVLASLALNFGPSLHIAVPSLFELATEQKWGELSEALHNFKGRNPELETRRHLEAVMLYPLFKNIGH